MDRVNIGRCVVRFAIMATVILASAVGAVVAQPAHAADETNPQATSLMRGGLPDGFRNEFHDGFAQVDGVRLHYVLGGPDDGPLVVLLHGWPQTWYTWRKVMPPLAKAGYRTLAIDYRGAGDSEKPPGGYDKATMAADIRALVHQLGASRINPVGRDIGVMIAYAYAAQWPDEVQTLTMLDVPIRRRRHGMRQNQSPTRSFGISGFSSSVTLPRCS
jgi:pimeloyl-ACP methyl ester carboxylesterase